MTVRHTLVVPVHNGSEFIHLFWHSLLPNVLKYTELLIVDDGSREEITRLVPQLPAALHARILRNDQPLGYARAVNRALAEARGTYVYLLNTDLILGHGAIELLHTTLEADAEVGVAGAKLLYPQTGKIQHFGLAFTPTRKFHIFTHMDPSDPMVSVRREFQAVTFALCAFRRALVDEVGYLDGDFCNGSEDIDYSLRIMKRGYRNVVPPEVVSFHWESLSGDGARHVSTLENEARFWGRWASQIHADITTFLADSLRAFLKKRPRYRSRTFTVINLSSGNDVQYVRAALASAFPDYPTFPEWDYSRPSRHQGSVWLPMTLPFDAIRNPHPYIFVVHEYPELLQNHYWFLQRRQYGIDDLVVDHYGNVLAAADPLFLSHAARQKSPMDVS